MKRADSGKNLPLSAVSNTGAQRPRIAPLPNRMYYNKNKVNGAFYAFKKSSLGKFFKRDRHNPAKYKTTPFFTGILISALLDVY
ncbi:hypothetical protein V3O24_18340 [Methylobacter sp. Wu8]|uniref:hypothetical protein n=1 Tax=Methylobacter sp. Wu8 TaxID=3118457 RepID=UPI002F33A2A0